MEKKITGYRVVYEDLDRKEAFKVANQHHWQFRLDNGFQYFLQIECVYDDGSYFAL